MATKEKKNLRWVVVLEDTWSDDDSLAGGPAGKDDVLDILSDMPGFKVISVSKQAK